MFQDLNDQILDIKEKQRVRNKLLRRLDSVNKSLQMLQNQRRDLEEILVKEEMDINKLNSLSLSALFHTILRDKEEQLNKERQEFLSVKLKYDECCEELKALKQEITSCEKSLQEYGGVDSSYEFLMEKKETMIIKNQDQNAQCLLEQFDKISNLQTTMNEMKEAIDAARNVKGVLEKVIDCLKSAENWGTWDMLGGGFLATSIKHDRMDEARTYVSKAQYLLKRFSKELADIQMNMNINIDISGFEGFADYFFDGLISDWVVQSKIENSLDNVQRVYRKTCEIIRELESRRRILELELNTLNRSVSNFIEEVK